MKCGVPLLQLPEVLMKIYVFVYIPPRLKGQVGTG